MPQFSVINTFTPVTANTNTQVAVFRNRRQYLFMQNVGTSDAYVSVNPMTAAGQGWILPAGGGREWSDLVPNNAMYVWCAGTTTVVVEEG